MRGGIETTIAGVPTVVLAQDSFAAAARAQAKFLGVPDLKLHVFPQYKPGNPQLLVEQAEEAARALPGLLLEE